METKGKNGKTFFSLTCVAIAYALLLSAIGIATYAWLSGAGLLSYVPVSSPEALYIGAGHRDIESNTFEDIRYMYFNGLDAEGDEYIDKVFCVYGKGVAHYRIQLAYTTNNPFTYEIYHATESTVNSAGAVEYVTHQETPETYYYSINGGAISGSFLNGTLLDGNGIGVADDTNHSDTYGIYDNEGVYLGDYDNVQKNAEPLYWQTSANPTETGNSRADFVNYYILRVYKNSKASNDRETDLLCIAAKSVTVHG